MSDTYITVDGCDVGISDTGGDNIPVFLFHGNSSSRSAYADLMKCNKGRYRLISVDFPGHGDTTFPAWASDGISISRLGTFANLIIKRFGFTDYVVVGQSIGGHALMENDEIMRHAAGICLLSSPPINEHSMAQAFVQSPAMPLLFQGSLDQKEIQRLADNFLGNDKKRFLPRIINDIRSTDNRFRSLLGLGLEIDGIRDERTSLSAFDHEVLMIRGNHDRFIDTRYYDSLTDIKLWKDTIFQFDCGHCISVEAPQNLWDCLTDYVDSVCVRK